MTAFCLPGRIAQSALQWLSTAVVFVALAVPAFADQAISVHLDEARIVKLPERATTVVIGNPLIADVSIQPGGLAVITGKGYGATNVVVLDKGSAVLMEKMIEVKGPNDPIVVVFRGMTRQTYSCTPDCSRRIALGDTSKDDWDVGTGLPIEYFGKNLAQTVSRNTQALAIGAASGH